MDPSSEQRPLVSLRVGPIAGARKSPGDADALLAKDSVTVIWDRRLREQRTTDRPVDRRRRHRRRPLPNPSGVLGFHMVRRQDAPP